MANNTYVNRTAQYQGQLTIPLYRSNISVPDPGFNGLNLIAGPGSDEAFFASGWMQQQISPNVTPGSSHPGGGVGAADIYILRPAGAAHLTINGGASNPYYTAQGNALTSGVVGGGLFAYPENREVNGASTLYQSVAGMLSVNDGEVIPYAPGFGAPEVNLMQAANIPTPIKPYMQRINAQVTLPGQGFFDGDNPIGLDVYGFASRWFNGSGTQDYYTITIPGFGDSSIKPPFSANNFTEGSFFNIPGVRGQNFAWSFINGSTAAHMYNYYCNLDGVGGLGLTFTGLIYNIIPSDPTLAAHFAAGSILAGMYNTANGMVIQDSIAGIDYYFSADGTKYWSLGYAMYASGIAPITRMSQLTGNSSIYFDKNGWAWVAPGNTTVAHVNNPLWSNGISIPYGFGQLPGIQPLSFPCWSACLDRIGGSPGMLAAGAKLN